MTTVCGIRKETHHVNHSRSYDTNILKLSLSHTFRTLIQNLEKALGNAMTVKSNASLTLKETSPNEDINTFTITQKG